MFYLANSKAFQSEKSNEQTRPFFLQAHPMVMVLESDLHSAGTSNNFHEFLESRLKIWNDGYELPFADFPPLKAKMHCSVFPLYKHTVAISPVLVVSSGFGSLLINILQVLDIVVFILVTNFCRSSETPEIVSQPRTAQQKRMLSEVDFSSNSHRDGM